MELPETAREKAIASGDRARSSARGSIAGRRCDSPDQPSISLPHCLPYRFPIHGVLGRGQHRARSKLVTPTVVVRFFCAGSRLSSDPGNVALHAARALRVRRPARPHRACAGFRSSELVDTSNVRLQGLRVACQNGRPAAGTTGAVGERINSPQYYGELLDPSSSTSTNSRGRSLAVRKDMHACEEPAASSPVPHPAPIVHIQRIVDFQRSMLGFGYCMAGPFVPISYTTKRVPSAM